MLLEGLVSKHKDRPYRAGRSPSLGKNEESKISGHDVSGCTQMVRPFLRGDTLMSGGVGPQSTQRTTTCATHVRRLDRFQRLGGGG